MKISTVAAIVVGIGGAAMIVDGANSGPWDIQQVSILVRVVFLGIIGLFIYLAPTGVAIIRRHPQWMAIFALNVLLGWTFLGWVVALVWALIKQRSIP